MQKGEEGREEKEEPSLAPKPMEGERGEKRKRAERVRLAKELEQKFCQTVTQEAASQHVEASEVIELYRNNVIRKKLKTAKDLKCWERRRYYHRVLKSILCHYEFS